MTRRSELLRPFGAKHFGLFKHCLCRSLLFVWPMAVRAEDGSFAVSSWPTSDIRHLTSDPPKDGFAVANIRPLLAAVTIQRFTIQRAERPNVWIRPQFPISSLFGDRRFSTKEIFLDFACRCFGELRQKFDPLGSLEVREVIACVVAKLGFGDGRARF